jgi:hypothetical protein
MNVNLMGNCHKCQTRGYKWNSIINQIMQTVITASEWMYFSRKVDVVGWGLLLPSDWMYTSTICYSQNICMQVSHVHQVKYHHVYRWVQNHMSKQTSSDWKLTASDMCAQNQRYVTEQTFLGCRKLDGTWTLPNPRNTKLLPPEFSEATCRQGTSNMHAWAVQCRL